MKKNMTCIICPMGCNLEIEITDEDIKVTGNTCPRGEQYAKNECTNPVRTLTTTMRCKNGKILPVKTDKPVPKDKLFECMEVINKTLAVLPISVGDIIIENILDTGSNVVASKEM